MRVNLETRGHQVTEARRGEEGLQLLGEIRPQLVILDMLLPDITGWHVLDAMQKDDALKNIPVILMTASVNRGETTNFPNLVKHLMKPVSMAGLLEAVDGAGV